MNQKEANRIVIRVDGSAEIGHGHVVRCIALANILKSDFDIIFYSLKVPPSLIETLKYYQFDYEIISGEEYFINNIQQEDIVILDNYELGTDYQKKIVAKEAKLVCIDDIHEKFFVADLILNHAAGISPSDYSAAPYSMFALGIEYALLRPAFLNQQRHKRTIKELSTVFVCFGGSDYNNLSELTISVLLSKNYFKKIILVSGSNYMITDKLKEVISSSDQIHHYHDVNETKMAALMLNSEVAIVPASGILMEALSLGCICISGMYIENQKFLYHQFKSLGYIFDAGAFDEADIRQAVERVLKTKQNLPDVNFNVNPKSTLKLFNALKLSNDVRVRLAENADIETTYAWATDPVIRENSFTTHIITYDEHNTWFSKKINTDICCYLIAEKDNVPIGSVRFDIENSKAKISYLLAPSFHGCGLGTIILQVGIKYIYNLDLFNFIDEIYGQVLFNNIPSIKAFRRLGFEEEVKSDHYLFTKKIIRK